MATARLSSNKVVIVGAGPAGIRCAETLLAAGFKPILIDENRRDGGQIYRRQPEGFTRDYATLYGTEAAKARDLHQSFDRLRERDRLPPGHPGVEPHAGAIVLRQSGPAHRRWITTR